MDVLDVFGDWGRFQRDILFVISLRSLTISCTLYLVHVSSSTFDHWCMPPDELRYMNTSEWKECCIPKTNGIFSQCKSYQSPFERFADNRSLVECNEWEYDGNKKASLISEWNLVCDKKWMVSLIYASFFSGNLLSYPVAGYVADRVGRRTCILLGIVGLLFSQLALYFSTSVIGFLVIRFLSGLPYTFLQSTTITLFMEVCGQRHRALSPLITGVIGAVGEYILLGAQVLLDDWRHVVLLTSVPILLPYLLLCWKFLSESPRWLIVTGRDAQAMEVLKLATCKNGIHVQDMDSIIMALGEKAQTRDNQQNRTGIRRFIMEKGLVCLTILLMISFMTNTFIASGFYVVIRNLGGSFSANFAISSVLKCVTSAINTVVLASFTKRRLTLILAFGLQGILFLVSTGMGSSLQWLRITTALIATTSNTLVYQTLCLLTNEFFPTSLRARGNTLCMTAGRIGALISSFADLLTKTHGPNAPFFIFGGLALAMSFFYLLVPEMNNRTLPDSLAESKKNLQAKTSQVSRDGAPEVSYTALRSI